MVDDVGERWITKRGWAVFLGWFEDSEPEELSRHLDMEIEYPSPFTYHGRDTTAGTKEPTHGATTQPLLIQLK
jgi:hypothetical protein